METQEGVNGPSLTGAQDSVEYHLYCASEDVSANALLCQVREVARELTKGRLWHCDALRFEEGSGEGAAGFHQIYGFLWYGPNVEDEWQTVRVVYALTERLPGLVARCTDSDDGELLLIEAADHLPVWIESHDKGDGRAFIYNSALHLVPRSVNAGNLQACLEAVLDEKVATLANDRCQSQIKERFDIADNNGLAGNALLPEPAAKILSIYPYAMSFALAGMRIRSSNVPYERERRLSGDTVRCRVEMTSLQVIEFHESLNEQVAQQLRDGNVIERDFEKSLGLWIHAALENAFSVTLGICADEELRLQFRNLFMRESRTQCIALLQDPSSTFTPASDDNRSLYNCFKADTSEQQSMDRDQLIDQAAKKVKDFFSQESAFDGVDESESEELHVDSNAVFSAVANALNYEEGPFEQTRREGMAHNDEFNENEDALSELNINAEAMENILRSIEAQSGSSGPAGNLLASMGLDVRDLMRALSSSTDPSNERGN
eukprot:Plantae.Rhodophyta-Purpureofilum_apyrenoidigerum.ctg1938.p1 GENE.Plantae.Rhodophyta-Purpureofilum_apyrenoidigerum.ctg1938~~Plantae.Rhodophyta-Purpureofilum_apyrenoidigerum.ctg1938.p1  ORF type:complete len:491 (-),score=92.15 Plantae.Rhodophyta-Purpureofilum_apyrenoidigerum.ctg1938:1161-2633(-)